MPITYPTFSGRQGMAILALVGGTSLLSYQMTRGIDGRVKEKESQRGFAAAHRKELAERHELVHLASAACVTPRPAKNANAKGSQISASKWV
ncbi:hypothetical protein K443DRAFT_685066 [Laccaria amethystina LaAM-08-1]|uniref:Uncharacterized protein n=1 Tax=Laccaria amethystina LaAM-08-1 TaxID=1095629 RepID=A0A0C9X555_9AGAR|nr:hypothetical protein K443DRAFT_685066 [Laccaria amethystina LaAM-08-1]